jgi:hypothetical protein
MHSIFFKPHNLTQKNPREQIQKSVMLNYGQTAEKRKKKTSLRNRTCTTEKRPNPSEISRLHRVNGRVAETRGIFMFA